MSVNDRGSAARAGFTSVAAAVHATSAQAGTSGFFFDFDGTLSAIVSDPRAARPVPGAAEVLSDLSSLVKKVAIISARPVEFLAARFPGLPDVDLFGLYGLESRHGSGPVVTHPDALPYQQLMADLADRARAELPEETYVEFKRLSLALHYRTSPAVRPALTAWAAAVADRFGLCQQPGRMVIELKPPATRDKGTVLAEQLAGLCCAWYFGDDVADVPAFDALAERHRLDPSFTGVRVAVGNPCGVDAETAGLVSAAADLTLAAPEAVPAFLHRVIKTRSDAADGSTTAAP